MNYTFIKPPLKAFLLSAACLTILLIQSSCNSYKKIPYFEDLSRTQITKEDLNNYSSFTIQPHDQIAISVGSTNPEAAAVFSNNQQNAGTTPANANYGYVVDEKGQVKLPLLGLVKVAGLTTNQTADMLQQQLLPYLKAPVVTVTVLNFKVAVIGDVLRPNIYSSNSERLTVTEALALAGDLNITAKREDVILVRERDGKREYIPIDLTSKDVFRSPYFYLKSNDLIYVTPGKAKLGTVSDKGYQNASLIISALSVLAITLSLIIRR
jgi:polysaccharide export outer membrane protein